MPRLTALALTALLLALPALPAHAQVESAEDRIVRQLKERGFEEIEVTRTWLGRVRIVAIEDDTLREIVLNPTTGAILRDYWTEIDDDDDEDEDEDDKRRDEDKDKDKDDDENEHRLLDHDDD